MRPPPLPRLLRAVAAILLAAVLARGYHWPVGVRVPFFEALVPLVDLPHGYELLAGAVLGGAALLFTGWAPRLGCLLAGSSLVLQTLGNLRHFSNGRLYVGLLLLLIGLHRTSRGTSLLRAQVVLLYVGAFLGKARDPDWWNGRTVAAVLAFHPSASWLPEVAFLPRVGGWLTMLVEGALALGFTWPRSRWLASLLCLGFHTWLVVLLREDFGLFYYAVVASCLLMADLPRGGRARVPAWAAPLARRGSLEDLEVEVAAGVPARLELPDRLLVGRGALVPLLVLSPVGLLAPVVFANLLPPPLQGLRSALLVGLALALGATILALAGPPPRGAALTPGWRAGGGRSPGGSP